ncbi:MAG: hypothetical protein ABR511_08180 [Acidimicrobiales bacterium]
MTSALCTHGLTAADCLICATLTPVDGREGAPARAPRHQRGPATDRGGRSSPAPPGRSRTGLVGVGIALLAVVLVGWWVLAVVALALHLAELVAVAAVSGWACWKLGVHHGRRLARGDH